MNAIELMHDAIGRIDLRDELKERYHYDAFTVPYPTLNLGSLHGGDALTVSAPAVSCTWISVRCRA